MKALFTLFTVCSLSQAAEVAGIHNMIGFGSNPTYVSHLPMYEHDLHRYQAVYEVRFEKKNDLTGKIFGISPKQKFTMPSLKIGSRFRAGLHPGHPEETEAMETVEVEVVRVVHFHALKPVGGERPKELSYFAVGHKHLVHLLTTPTIGLKTPADQFDQVVEIERAIKAGGNLEELEIPDGALVKISVADTAANRLVVTPDSKHFTRALVKTANGPVEVMLHVGREIYIHTGGDVRIEN